MTDLWPWLAVAGLGALHGLHPGSGWMLAAACGLRARRAAGTDGVGDGAGDGAGGRDGAGIERRQALRALVPIGAGHLASIALVAAAVALGGPGARTMLLVPAAALLAGAAVRRVLHREAAGPRRASAPRATLALWAFVGSTVHGAGLMLVPALIPLCMASAPAREITASGSLALALAAVALHATAMLAVSGALAVAACRAVRAGRGLAGRRWPDRRRAGPPSRGCATR